LLVEAPLEKPQQLKAMRIRLAELDRQDAAPYTNGPVGWGRDGLGEYRAQLIGVLAGWCHDQLPSSA